MSTDSSIDWHGVRASLANAIANRQLSIVVPTFNAEASIDITLTYYQQLGVPVSVFVDSKSADRTEEIARRLASDVSVIDNDASIVEGMIQKLSTRSNATWVLRIDDDEFPTKAMLAYVADVIKDESVHAVGFVRKQCAVSQQQNLKASTVHLETDHRQWRLYRPACMTWTDSLHTAGFVPVADHSQAAPPHAFLVHLDWSLHDRASRAAKVQRYDTHTQGKGSMWRSFYLYEDDPSHGPDQFTRVNAPELQKTCESIVKRFPQNCVSEPPPLARLRAWWRERRS